MTLGVNTDTCDILVDDKLVINYVIHNESTQKIKALEMWMIQDISFTAKGHNEYYQSTLCNVRLDASELSDGIERVAKECLTSVLPSESIDALSMELISKKNEVVFKIPDSIRPTYNGKLGNVNYRLFAKICTPFLVEDPTFEIPLRAHCNPKVSKNLLNGISADEEYAVEIPSDWNPSISADQVNLDRPSNALKSSNSSSVESLKELLSNSSEWNETYIVRDWIWKGNLDELLVDDNLADIYRFMKSEYSYIVISDYFSNALKGKMTCKLICSAARVPKYKQVESRIGILANFASNCIDKSNAKETFQSIAESNEETIFMPSIINDIGSSVMDMLSIIIGSDSSISRSLHSPSSPMPFSSLAARSQYASNPSQVFIHFAIAQLSTLPSHSSNGAVLEAA
jgi:hypothetical protein